MIDTIATGRVGMLARFPLLVMAASLGCSVCESAPLPQWIDLDRGEAKSVVVSGPGGELRREIRVLDVTEYEWPNWHLPDLPTRKVLRAAAIEIEVSGTRATLWARAFEPPRVVNGLRLFVESTRRWGTTPQLDPLSGLTGEVRLSCVAEGIPWGPADLRFPIRKWRWNANTYANTWGALVPYNKLYYHRGEDFGAIPDELEVLASLGGTITRSPLPTGDGGSNRLELRDASGLEFEYAHMNLETIPLEATKGATVAGGQTLGRTGMTWDGRKSQANDPHLHWGVARNGQAVGSYPFALDAYFQDYPDSAVAVAGGYHYALPGEPVELDASRSVARPGRRIVRCEWRLHDGRVVAGEKAQVTSPQAGLFSEELRVWADDGSEYRDYAQLRVWDPLRGARIGGGWFYHSPVRGARIGTPIRFWNRLWGNTEAVRIDFGDGAPEATIDNEIVYAYSKPGIYTARLHTRGPEGEPMEVRMRVVVD